MNASMSSLRTSFAEDLHEQFEQGFSSLAATDILLFDVSLENIVASIAVHGMTFVSKADCNK